MPLTIEWSRPSLLEASRTAWRELAENALEPNPFYEFDYLAASERHLDPNNTLKVVVVWLHHENGGRQMVGLFPVHTISWSHGFYRPTLSLYRNKYICSTTPLIHRDMAPDVWRAFADEIADVSKCPNYVHLPLSYMDGPVVSVIKNTVAADFGSVRQLERRSRPAAQAQISFDDYTRRYSKKRRKKQRQFARNLEQAGEVEYEVVKTSDKAFLKTLDDFLKLEASGWKGENGSALASQSMTEAFAREALGSAKQSPNVHFDVLRLDGQIIAINANLVCNDEVFCFKSAYDEAYSRLRPGVMLDLKVLQSMLDGESYKRVDSCANQGHHLAPLWLEPVEIGSMILTVSTKSTEKSLDNMLWFRSALKKSRALVRAGRPNP